MDYKENSITGVVWSRFSRISIDNPRNGIPSISCLEQQVMSIGGAETLTQVGTLKFNFDPSSEVPLLDPTTNEPTGEMTTGAKVHQLIYSYVMMEAAKRDAAALAEQSQ